MRLLAIDLGRVNTGLAIGENNNTLPIDSIKTKNQQYLIEEVLKVIKSEKIDKVLVGIPFFNNSKQEQFSKDFITKLSEVTQVSVEGVNESFTSKKAFSDNFSKHSQIKKLKKQIHSKSAEEILKNYFLTN